MFVGGHILFPWFLCFAERGNVSSSMCCLFGVLAFLTDFSGQLIRLPSFPFYSCWTLRWRIWMMGLTERLRRPCQRIGTNINWHTVLTGQFVRAFTGFCLAASIYNQFIIVFQPWITVIYQPWDELLKKFARNMTWRYNTSVAMPRASFHMLSILDWDGRPQSQSQHLHKQLQEAGSFDFCCVFVLYRAS